MDQNELLYYFLPCPAAPFLACVIEVVGSQLPAMVWYVCIYVCVSVSMCVSELKKRQDLFLKWKIRFFSPLKPEQGKWQLTDLDGSSVCGFLTCNRRGISRRWLKENIFSAWLHTLRHFHMGVAFDVRMADCTHMHECERNYTSRALKCLLIWAGE